METWLLAVLCAVIVVIIFIAGVFAHAGYFSDIRIRTSFPASLPRRVAYVVRRGPYQNVYDSLQRITTIAPDQKHFCVFYDDPKKVLLQVYH